jgi:aryl-alcohol dehydrogenase-like predicted oxidoreductase
MNVSSFGLGCVTFGREIDEATSFRIMDHALARGINLFDTAEAYAAGASESIVGRWLRARGVRQQVLIATKLGPAAGGDALPRGYSAARIAQQVEGSLRRLGVDCIDLYQLHVWDASVPLEETLEGLDRVVRQGKVRAVGCSNFTTWQLCRALWVSDKHGWAPLQSVQNGYSLTRPEWEREMLPFCAYQGVGFLAYSPLAAGFLTGKYYREGGVPAGTRFEVVPGHQGIYFTEARWSMMEKVRAKAEALGAPMARLALAWVITQPAVTCTLVGARNPEQVDNAFEAESLGMDAALRAELSSYWPTSLSSNAGDM